jgi:hypothetical protein
MVVPSKTANFGGSVDISSRQSGSFDALKDLGMASPAPQLKDLGKTRLGGKPEKTPKSKVLPAHQYTTSGSSTNPKVAFLKEAAQEDAPNYGKASSPITACAKCKQYEKQDKVMGHCEKYNFYPGGSFTCDSWKTRNGRAPSQFIKLKLR